MQTKFEGIIFDLGNVVVDFNHWIAVNKIAKFSPFKPQKIYNFFFDSDLTVKFEKGQISPSIFFAKIKKELKLNITQEEFIPIWNEIFFLSKKNLQIHQIIKRLKNKYYLILLSNINQLHFDYLKKHMNIFGKFDKLVLSYKVKAIKPSLKIYKKALEGANLTPDKVFYIDDRRDLIEKAHSFGIRSFCLNGNVAELEKTLLGLGIR